MSKYGKVTVEGKDIPEDEPVFVLRGQDSLAHLAVLYYADLLANHNRLSQSEEVRCFAATMRAWANEHGKMPD